MNYEKKYKEALKRATKAKNNASLSDGTLRILGIIFPELVESEERKVKRILHSISSKIGFHLHDIFTEEEFQCFDAWSHTWLEKQDENYLTDKIISKFNEGKQIMPQEDKELLLKNLEWIDMETRECHCYNCELFDSKNNICKCIDLCKNPKSTYKGFYIK